MNSCENQDWDVISNDEYEKLTDLQKEIFNDQTVELTEKPTVLSDSDEPSTDEDSDDCIVNNPEEDNIEFEYDFDFTSENSEKELFPSCVYWKQYYTDEDLKYLKPYRTIEDKKIVKRNNSKKTSPKSLLYYCTWGCVAFIVFSYLFSEPQLV